MNEENSGATLVDHVAGQIKAQIVQGLFKPGEHLSEKSLQENLNVSRNTLREGFRILTKEGLLNYQPNRGVFVATPDLATIIDVYRIRRYVECQAIKEAQSFHPAIKRMRLAVEDAFHWRNQNDWLKVGSADIDFHAAIVSLSDSPRLSSFFNQINAQLRLVFGLLDDPHSLHAAFIDQNDLITQHLEKAEVELAEKLLAHYLVQSERYIITAYMRHHRHE